MTLRDAWGEVKFMLAIWLLERAIGLTDDYPEAKRFNTALLKAVTEGADGA